MSLREEDRQKNGCPSRGLGLAAAAIGVGVGAALYYIFSKQPENPSNEGASSENWHCESPQTLHEDTDISDDSYSTISVNTTTDTSFHDSSCSSYSSNGVNTVDEDEDATMDDDELSNSYSSTSTQYSTSSSDSNSSYSDLSGYSPISSIPDDTGMTTSYYYSPARSVVSAIRNTLRWHSRERRWSLEECSICFEVILRDQEVMALPCTHNFHQACILPWLQQKQTCPNCRKNVD